MRVLALTALSPYPPTGGGRMRAHHLIAGMLEAGHEITVVSLSPDPPASVPARPSLRVIGTTTRSRTGWRRLSALVSPYPEEAWARPPGALGPVGLDPSMFDVVLAMDSRTARPAISFAENRIPIVIDEFNVEFALAAALANIAPTAFGRLRGRLDAAKTRAFEARVLRRCDLVTCVSAGDARVLRTLAGGTPVQVHPSGADVAGITMVDHRVNRRDRIILTGTMGYLPNLDAARYLGAEILPRVRAARPTVHAHLVGQISDYVRAAITADGIEAIGAVPDVMPHLANADVFVAPLRVGGGTRLKILEALASGIPVVATPKAVEGLDIQHDVHALVAPDAASLAQAILDVLADEERRHRLAAAGRRLVEEKYDWRSIGTAFAASVERVATSARNPRQARRQS